MNDMAFFLAAAERGFVLDADDVVDSLIGEGVLLPVDWSGEDRPGQIAQFVAGRVAAFGKDHAVVAAVESAAREAAGKEGATNFAGTWSALREKLTVLSSQQGGLARLVSSRSPQFLPATGVKPRVSTLPQQ